MINSQFTLPTEYDYREEILQPLIKLIDWYVDNHSKTKVIRFDLHFPKDYPMVKNNYQLSETIAYIVKQYQRQGLSPKYFWTMEQNQSSHPHYHVVLFLDGQKTCSYSHVFHNVENEWARVLNANVQGCVHHCNLYQGKVDMNRNGLEIRHCDGEEEMTRQVQAVYNQVSYLAKTETKTDEKDGLRNFGLSRLPK